MATDPHRKVPFTRPDEARRKRRSMFLQAKREGGVVVVEHKKVA